jgi:hypothetical protein
MTKIQNSKPVLLIEYWNLIFCNAPSLQQTAARGERPLKFPQGLDSLFSVLTINPQVILFHEDN